MNIKIVNQKSKIKILILGSCVSRDPFNDLENNYTDFTLVDYFARTSLASLALNPASKEIDTSKINSPFRRRMLERDIKKSFLTEIHSLDFDLLLLDFIDDRFDIIQFADGSGLTESNELKELEFNFNAWTCNRVQTSSEDFFLLWKKGLKILIDKLKEINKINCLVINKVFMAEMDDAGNKYPSQEWIFSRNKYLQKAYFEAKTQLPSIKFIEYENIDFKTAGKSDHQWGRASYHFVEKINSSMLNQLKNQTI